METNALNERSLTEEITKHTVSLSVVTGPLELAPVLEINIMNSLLFVTHLVLIAQQQQEVYHEVEGVTKVVWLFGLQVLNCSFHHNLLAIHFFPLLACFKRTKVVKRHHSLNLSQVVFELLF
jgi:hypothetical protein